jgi:4-hydroxybenzoate polyprenyltransferase
VSTLNDLDKRLRLYHIQLIQFIGLATDIQNRINQNSNLDSALFTILSFIIAFFQLLVLYQTSLINKLEFLIIVISLIVVSVYFHLKRRKTLKEADELKLELHELIKEMSNSVEE